METRLTRKVIMCKVRDINDVVLELKELIGETDCDDSLCDDEWCNLVKAVDKYIKYEIKQ